MVGLMGVDPKLAWLELKGRMNIPLLLQACKRRWLSLTVSFLKERRRDQGGGIAESNGKEQIAWAEYARFNNC